MSAPTFASVREAARILGKARNMIACARIAVDSTEEHGEGQYPVSDTLEVALNRVDDVCEWLTNFASTQETRP